MKHSHRTALLITGAILCLPTMACQLHSGNKAYMQPANYAQNHDSVFIGKLINLVESNSQKATFDVVETLTGPLLPKQIEVENVAGSCRSFFRQVGDTYVVMVNYQLFSGYKSNGVFFGINSNKLSDNETAKIQAIKSLNHTLEK